MAIFTGAHGISNGLDTILDTANLLKEKSRRDIKIVMIGAGMMKKSLIERAEREALHNIIFHDPVDKDTLSGLMASADVGLQILANIPAFYYGTFPNKFFDYFSVSLTVITNYPGWIADIITENHRGHVTTLGNPEAFADVLIDLADNRKLLLPMGNASRALAKRCFDREHLADQFVAWVVDGRRISHSMSIFAKPLAEKSKQS